MELSLPRGMRDFGPSEYEALENIRYTFVEVARIFGFRLMEPSPIEMLQTLEAKSGVGIRNEVYNFEDKGGREVGLRFDLTVGLTRYVVSNRGLPQPVKLGVFSDMWRYDEPQYGRFRWFYQWDVEIFGTKSVEAEAEVIEFAWVLLNKLGLHEVSIEIGDRRIVEEFIRTKLGVNNDEEITNLLRSVDKLQKKKVNDIISENIQFGTDVDTVKKMLEFGSIKGKPDEIISLLSKYGITNISDLMRFTDLLNDKGVKNFELNMGIVRGLDYYNGLVFEIFEKGKLNIGALAGGGRYDILPSVFGRDDIGAVGIAGGVERTILALSNKDKKTNPILFVAYTNEKMSRIAAKISSRLRLAGIPTDLEVSGRSLKKQFEYASKFAPLILVVGPQDYDKNEITLRNMKEGSEIKISLDKLEVSIKKIMKGLVT